MAVTRIKSHNLKTVVRNRMEDEKVAIQNPEECDAEITTLSELIIALSRNAFCKQSRHLIRTPDSAFTFDKNEVLVK